MRMTECFVRNCAETAVQVVDLDPEKIGGPYSYPYEVGLCVPHADAIRSGAPWVCRTENGARTGGWEVLLGEDIKLLDEWKLTAAGTVNSGEKTWRTSEGLVPDGWRITLPLQQIGTEEPVLVNLRLTRDQAKELREDLKLLSGE